MDAADGALPCASQNEPVGNFPLLINDWSEEGDVAEEVRLHGAGVDCVGDDVVRLEPPRQLTRHQQVRQLRGAVDPLGVVIPLFKLVACDRHPDGWHWRTSRYAVPLPHRVVSV